MLSEVFINSLFIDPNEINNKSEIVEVSKTLVLSALFITSEAVIASKTEGVIVKETKSESVLMSNTSLVIPILTVSTIDENSDADTPVNSSPLISKSVTFTISVNIVENDLLILSVIPLDSAITLPIDAY
jgi:hypothetical protein